MTPPVLTLLQIIGSWKRRHLDVFLEWQPSGIKPWDYYTIFEQTDKDGSFGPWKRSTRIYATHTAFIRTIPDRGRFNWYVTATDEAGNQSPPSNTQGMAATAARNLVTNPGNLPT